jgi:hypothetical protein
MANEVVEPPLELLLELDEPLVAGRGVAEPVADEALPLLTGPNPGTHVIGMFMDA